MLLNPERSEQLALRLFRHVADNTTDLAAAVMTFAAATYADRDVAAKEHENIFYTQPMMAAHSSELAQPDCFVTVPLNRSNVILTRKTDGTVGAFVNACRHRGAKLVDAQRGQRKLFTCKYHAWSYGNDGALRNVSFAGTFGTLPCAETNLIALPVEERHGFIWVVEDPGGTIDIAKFLGPDIDERLAGADLQSYHSYKSEVVEFPQNWKIMADGLLDGYHVRFLHAKTIAPYVYHNIMAVDTMTDHGIWVTPRKRIDEVRHLPAATVDLARYVIYGIFIGPNTQLVVHPHHIEFWTLLQHPEGPRKSRALLRFITPHAVENAEQQVTLDKNYEILLKAVFEEDVPAGNGVQESAAMPQVRELLLGRNEVLNQLFHRTYNRLMAGEALGDTPNSTEYGCGTNAGVQDPALGASLQIA